jgi:hypothetical protein
MKDRNTLTLEQAEPSIASDEQAPKREQKVDDSERGRENETRNIRKFICPNNSHGCEKVQRHKPDHIYLIHLGS